MEKQKFINTIFKVAYMPTIPKLFRRLLLNSTPVMTSEENGTNQYSSSILLIAVDEEPDFYNSPEEIAFIKELEENKIEYIEF